MDIIPIILSAMENIRSYGEGLKVISQAFYTYHLSKELGAKHDQAFHHRIQSVLGFKTPQATVKAQELEDKETGALPMSFFYGFFQIRYYKDTDPVLCWTYYKVYITLGYSIEFVSNENQVIRFVGKKYAFTKDYFLIYDKKIISIYHSRPLVDHKIFEDGIDMKEFIPVQKDKGVMLIYKMNTQFNIAFISDKGSFTLLKTFTDDLFYNVVGTTVCGYYGIYKSEIDRISIIDYFTDKEESMPPFITSSSGTVSVKNEYPEIDAVYLDQEGGFYYDVKNKKIAWIFSEERKRNDKFDSFILNGAWIVDIITGRILLNLIDYTHEFFLTRKDDNTGYWIWIYTSEAII